RAQDCPPVKKTGDRSLKVTLRVPRNSMRHQCVNSWHYGRPEKPSRERRTHHPPLCREDETCLRCDSTDNSDQRGATLSQTWHDVAHQRRLACHHHGSCHC